jgi:hypothetical protein
MTFTGNSSLITYLNDSPPVSRSISGLPSISSQPLRIGLSNDSYWSAYNGRTSLVQIYNRALSSSEVLQNYNATKARFGLT